MQLNATYAGRVVDIKDPDGLGRIKARVPVAYGGTSGDENAVSDTDIPWALPAGLPAGNSEASGGIDWLPEVGDQVFVRFLDGEPEKPIWEWGSQTNKAPALAAKGSTLVDLHEQNADRTPTGAKLTRYGHVVEFKEKRLTVRTKNGNVFVLDDTADTGVLSTLNLLALVAQERIQVASSDLDVETSATSKFTSDKTAIKSREMAVVATEKLTIAGDKLLFVIGGMTFSIVNGQLTATTPEGAVIGTAADGSVTIASPNGSSATVKDDSIEGLIPDGSAFKVEKDQVQVKSKAVVAECTAGKLGGADTSVEMDGTKVDVKGKTEANIKATAGTVTVEATGNVTVKSTGGQTNVETTGGAQLKVTNGVRSLTLNGTSASFT